MTKDLIKKILKEYLDKIIITENNRNDYNLDETFDTPLKNMDKVDGLTYIVYEDNIKAKATFRMEFNHNDFKDFPTIKSNLIDKYYSVSWSFIENTEKTSHNWIRVTATMFKVLDDFIRNFKPNLIKFSDQKETGKIYYHSEFEKKLKSLFPDYYPLVYENEAVFMVKKELTNVREMAIQKTMEEDGNSLTECQDYYYFPHKNKDLFSGGSRNRIIKEQVKRIINKIKYL